MVRSELTTALGSLVLRLRSDTRLSSSLAAPIAAVFWKLGSTGSRAIMASNSGRRRRIVLTLSSRKAR